MKKDPDLLPVGSLQNSLLGETLAFDIAGDESVQILHCGGNHWVTISTVGTEHPTVRVYDSLYCQLPFSTKEQIATLLHTKQSAITLEYANVQVSIEPGGNRNNYIYYASHCLYRSRRMDLIVVFLLLLLQWPFATGKNQKSRLSTSQGCGTIW